MQGKQTEIYIIHSYGAAVFINKDIVVTFTNNIIKSFANRNYKRETTYTLIPPQQINILNISSKY